MPLTSGYLPFPLVRISKYIPGETSGTGMNICFFGKGNFVYEEFTENFPVIKIFSIEFSIVFNLQFVSNFF